MSNSVFQQNLKEKFKQKRIDSLSKEEKLEHRLKTLDQFFLQLGNNENRYIFYCPDIVVVNSLIKEIYDIAYILHKSGYQVTILHEIKGFQCKWLYETYPEYKEIPLEYIISKRSKKSKKDTNQYSFKPLDTLIVPDVFQEVLENLIEVKLIQKVVLVSSYSGIGSLPMGNNYSNLGVNTAIFLNNKLKQDYESIETFKNSFLLNQKLDTKLFDISQRDNKNIYPIVCINKIGNDKLAQQIINIFYNKFPHLRFVSFKFLNRTNYQEYVESLKYSCLYLELDENIGFDSQISEVLQLNLPVASFVRREYSNQEKFQKYIFIGEKDPFVIVDFLVTYLVNWLNSSNKEVFDNFIPLIKSDEQVEKENQAFELTTLKIVKKLKEERVEFFAAMKQLTEKNEQ